MTILSLHALIIATLSYLIVSDVNVDVNVNGDVNIDADESDRDLPPPPLPSRVDDPNDDESSFSSP